ncbi:MAG: hypothetical protein KAS73_09940 [Candidatus Sabulitectum sp.]|nr:hypothetical protein [Candidatus Sabulitectum sp.]
MIPRILLLAFMFIAIMSGCSNDPAQEVVAESDTPPAEETVIEESIPEEAPVTVEVPIVDAHVTLESTNGGYTDAEAIDWSTIVTQQAKVLVFSDHSICTILLANFETEEYLKTVDLEPGQAVVYFTLNQSAESVPVAGVYDLTVYDGEFTGSAGIRIAGGVTVMISMSNIITGELEITHVTAEAATGSFAVQDRWTEMSGEFQAPII